MHQNVWRVSVGLLTVCALLFTEPQVALAYDGLQTDLGRHQTATSDRGRIDSGYSLEDHDYTNSRVKLLLDKELRISNEDVDNFLSDMVSPSLSVEDSSQISAANETVIHLDRQKNSLKSLPSINEVTGEVSLPSRDAREEFSIGAKDHVVTETEDGVARTHDKDVESQVSAVSYVTEDKSGQIIGVIKEADITFMDFNYVLPSGYELEERVDGGFDLVSDTGEIEGEIDAPWAIDSMGRQLSTKFELVDDNTLRQHVTTDGAVFPIVLDPSWSWWLITAGKCAISIAPLLVTGGAAVAARAPKLISLINKLSKSSKIGSAVRKVGGAKNAAVAAVKKAVLTLRSKVPKGIASKIPSPRLTSQEKVFIAAAWPFLVDNFWDVIGIGSCYSLVKGG